MNKLKSILTFKLYNIIDIVWAIVNTYEDFIFINYYSLNMSLKLNFIIAWKEY